MHEKERAVREHPTWDADIKPILTSPPWLPQSKRIRVGLQWKSAMLKYGAPMPDGNTLTLDNYEHVKLQAPIIYRHCASRSMPITNDPSEYWPSDVLETFLLWINQGCRKSDDDAVHIRTPPLEEDKTRGHRVRKDICALTADELQLYRAKIQDILQVESVDSIWQELGEIHAWWCLHYQEATFPWHRCWLKYVETLIDFPIPYWNGFAVGSDDPESPHAGIPQIFLDETYEHPDGSVRKNPLKYAYAYQARSRDGTSAYVQRNPVLVKGRPRHPGPDLDAWNNEIALFGKYHKQIIRSLKMRSFSKPQGIGIPWAVIPTFGKDMPDNLYAAQESFDGWFEQAHDNFHGWIGGSTGDMADNTYTAFDPIFLSYHCNMDRLYENYLRAHPETRFTTTFPLRPFTKGAEGVDYTNPQTWTYANLGEMTQDSITAGYVYAPPTQRDAHCLARSDSSHYPEGGAPMTLKVLTGMPDTSERVKTSDATPFIIFRDVVCTDESYQINVFLKGAKSTQPDPSNNPDFVGGLFRMGMGVPHGNTVMKNKQRCRKESVLRVIEADHVADKIQYGFFQVVHKVAASGRVEVPEKVWKNMKGFTGELAWIV